MAENGRARYIAFHKPYGVLTQFTPGKELVWPSGVRTLKDYIQVPGVYAVGRLDKDSEGLLLLTDDGQMQHLLSDPRFEHEKTYWVQVEGEPDSSGLAMLEQGVEIPGGTTKPARARRLLPEPVTEPREPPIRVRKAIPTSWIELTLTEGRNRQVRRMTAAVGYPTLRLIRVAIGPCSLAGLKPGQWRDLSPKEKRTLRNL